MRCWIWILSVLLLYCGFIDYGYAETIEIPYQGVIVDKQGSPVNGTYAFYFTLYDAIIDGNMVWS